MQDQHNIPYAVYSPYRVDASPFASDIEIGFNRDDIERIEIKTNVVEFRINLLIREIESINADIRDIKKEIAPTCFKFIDHLILYVFIIVVYLKVYGVIP